MNCLVIWVDAKNATKLVTYFWYDKFENDEFESNKFILCTRKLDIFKLITLQKYVHIDQGIH